DGTWALVHARQADAYARLLAEQIRATGPALDDAATALENDTRAVNGTLDNVLTTLGTAVNDVFTNGLTPDQAAALGRSGISRSDLATSLSAVHRLGLADRTVADMADNLRSLAADGDGLADSLDDFADTVTPLIAGLEADPLVADEGPSAHAGGP